MTWRLVPGAIYEMKSHINQRAVCKTRNGCKMQRAASGEWQGMQLAVRS
jgi:hypothetical protein